MISEIDIATLSELLGPCTGCNGTGGFYEAMAPGERSRYTSCSECGGKQTVYAQRLRGEYVRGWDAAFERVSKELTSLKRSRRL